MVCSVAASDEHRFSLDGQSKQFITININSINPNFKSFGEYVNYNTEVDYYSDFLDIRLNSYQYTQLHNRLTSPVRVARNVVIHQSLSDRFSAAFAEQVEQNGLYILPEGSTVRIMLCE